jgi:hypothetical protein
VGLLDEILKQLEEAQNEGRPRPQPQQNRAPERESDEDGAEWEEDEAARPSHAPHIPSRTPAPVAVVAEAPPARTTVDSRPAPSPHERGEASALHIRAMMTSRASLRDALVLREVLGPPPGLKHLRRRP